MSEVRQEPSYGKELLPCVYTKPVLIDKMDKLYMENSFSEGLTVVQKDGKYVYVNPQGEEVLSVEYDYSLNFAEGLAMVERDNKWGYINTQGEEVVSCEYDSLHPFSEGLAIAWKNSKLYILKDTEYKAPMVEEIAVPTAATATPTGNTLLVDGAEKLPAAYMINDNNYFKLRDVAALLNGTQAQFSIGWDGVTGAITITTGEAYTALGTELQGKPTDVATAQTSQSTIYINGQKADLTAYLINDNNYFKLRDLGKALGFNVSWDGVKGAVLIESNKPYSDAD